MKALFRSPGRAPLINLALVVLAGGAWQTCDYIYQHLSNLPVERVASKNAPALAAGFDARALFPVWVSAAGTAARSAPEHSSADLVFQASVSSTEVAPPDYPRLLAARLQLDSISTDGAFINGKFYRRGAAIGDFEYPWRGRQVVPVLAEVHAAAVVIVHGAFRTELRL